MSIPIQQQMERKLQFILEMYYEPSPVKVHNGATYYARRMYVREYDQTYWLVAKFADKSVPTIYRVTSKSCSCPGNTGHGHCWHTRWIKELER